MYLFKKQTWLTAGMLLTLTACGGGGGGSSGEDSPPPPSEQVTNQTVGGSVFGLLGTLVLQNNNGDALTLTADGTFVFSDAIAAGSSYAVTVQSQPANQVCTVSNGSGTVADAAITNITVNCSTLTRSVGVTVYGLDSSESVVLQNNNGDALTLTADGTFVFSDAIAAGSSYAVTVQSQPANQVCTVSNGSGTVADAAITNITVNCSTLTRSVGVTVYGLDSSESVVLQNNNGDDLAVNGNGSFEFATRVAQSGAYAVAVLTHPATQTCSVTDGSGTAGTTDISDVQVTCSTNAYTVGSIVSGLSGTVILQNNGSDNLNANSGGSYTFSTPVAQGANYNVTIFSHPTTQTCVVTNGSGTMGAASVTNVSVSCTTNTTTLSTSVSDLALSATGLTEYGVSGAPSSGVARTITITNMGSHTALNVSVTSPTWPAGTTLSGNTCTSTLPQGSSCTVTITPGATATSDGTNPCTDGTAPVPRTLQATADNASTVSSNVVVLSYGCIYQGGYVYAFDDTTPTTGSVGGKVAATADQASPSSGIIWSSNGNGAAAYDAIYGISETSTLSAPDPSIGVVAGQSACNGNTDGACNTNNIYTYYQTVATNAPISDNSYAAGFCKSTISGYRDWYLPAVCELGTGSPSCGTSGAPALQNMQSNLVDLNGLSLLAGLHYTSTEYAASPASFVWTQYFDVTGGDNQSAEDKATPAGVRCSRALSV